MGTSDIAHLLVERTPIPAGTSTDRGRASIHLSTIRVNRTGGRNPIVTQRSGHPAGLPVLD
jgi:hypothetical protein